MEAVWITGIGAFWGPGLGLRELRERFAGEPGEPVPREDVEDAYRCFVSRKQGKYVIRLTAYGITAAGRALKDAGIPATGWEPEEVGVFSASSVRPPRLELDEQVKRLSRVREGGATASARLWEHYQALHDPIDLLRGMVTAPADHIAVARTLRGPTCCFLGGSSAGLTALRAAAREVSSGRQRAMLVIASDSRTNPWWKLVSDEQGEADDRRVPTDGAAAIVLEAESSARRRAAPGYARVEASAVRSGGCARGALVRAMRCALASAGGPIDALLASGDTATTRGAVESEAIASVFGDRRPSVLSSAATVGHVGAAAGVLDAGLASTWLSGGDTSLGAVRRVMVNGSGDAGDAASLVLAAVS